MNKTVLVTGGAGYIGSHTVLALNKAGFNLLVIDNFSNSNPEVFRRISSVTNGNVECVEGDIRDRNFLDLLFIERQRRGVPVDTVMHFAALKAVGESVALPVEYYINNVAGTLSLLGAMDAADVKKIVFSSSATVYGAPEFLPFTEDHKIAPTNPYGWSKAMVEQILKDWANAWRDRAAIALRYFNPIGAHRSGHFGESPTNTPNNLFPYIAQVAIGKRDYVSVFGDDYPTPDGTGVRDYLHVEDLADGHVAAGNYLRGRLSGFEAVNLGTGLGTSVLELIAAFEAASNRPVAYRIEARRVGDVAAAWADPSLARALFGWSATKTVEEMCEDGWRWQLNNPNGYRAR